MSRVAQLCIVCRDDQIRHHRQFTAPCDRVAMYLSNRNFCHIPEIHLNVRNLLHAGTYAHDEGSPLFVDGFVRTLLFTAG